MQVIALWLDFQHSLPADGADMMAAAPRSN
jgi:hypothetical protein